jgi:hypothetical protein
VLGYYHSSAIADYGEPYSIIGASALAQATTRQTALPR